jgi:hypothetical protein
MIKVPGTPNPKFHKIPAKDDGFDPTRDDWSRHEDDSRSSNSDGVGFLEEDDDLPSWYEEDTSSDDERDHFYRVL